MPLHVIAARGISEHSTDEYTAREQKAPPYVNHKGVMMLINPSSPEGRLTKKRSFV